MQGELEAQQAAVAETAAALAESEAAKAEAQQLAQRLQQELQVGGVGRQLAGSLLRCNLIGTLLRWACCCGINTSL